ncbi:hypothetical protein BgiMline_035669, partial [Biomphalaria glabrata]
MPAVTLLAIVLSAVLYDTVSGCTTCSVSETGTCDAYNSYINCLKDITAANGCSSLEVTAAAVGLSSLNSLQCSETTTVMTSIVCVCSVSETGTCDAYNSYINCLKGITAEKGCSALEETAASVALSSLNSLQCSGTTTVTTTIVLMAALSFLSYILIFNELAYNINSYTHRPSTLATYCWNNLYQ